MISIFFDLQTVVDQDGRVSLEGRQQSGSKIILCSVYLDIASRAMFPVAFGVFNMIYWIYYLNVTEYWCRPTKRHQFPGNWNRDGKFPLGFELDSVNQMSQNTDFIRIYISILVLMEKIYDIENDHFLSRDLLVQ